MDFFKLLKLGNYKITEGRPFNSKNFPNSWTLIFEFNNCYEMWVTYNLKTLQVHGITITIDQCFEISGIIHDLKVRWMNPESKAWADYNDEWILIEDEEEILSVLSMDSVELKLKYA